MDMDEMEMEMEMDMNEMKRLFLIMIVMTDEGWVKCEWLQMKTDLVIACLHY